MHSILVNLNETKIIDGVREIAEEVFVPILNQSMEKQELATAHICKNSTGQVGEIQVRTNFKHLAWRE